MSAPVCPTVKAVPLLTTIGSPTSSETSFFFVQQEVAKAAQSIVEFPPITKRRELQHGGSESANPGGNSRTNRKVELSSRAARRLDGQRGSLYDGSTRSAWAHVGNAAMLPMSALGQLLVATTSPLNPLSAKGRMSTV